MSGLPDESTKSGRTGSLRGPVNQIAKPREVLPWVDKLAHLLDTAWRVPGTKIRFGLDPIIGLVPVLGDTVTFVVGLFMLREARRLELGAGVKARMVWNLAVDWLVGLVPGLDIILDTAVKAHTKNAKLLKERAGN